MSYLIVFCDFFSPLFEVWVVFFSRHWFNGTTYCLSGCVDGWKRINLHLSSINQTQISPPDLILWPVMNHCGHAKDGFNTQRENITAGVMMWMNIYDLMEMTSQMRSSTWRHSPFVCFPICVLSYVWLDFKLNCADCGSERLKWTERLAGEAETPAALSCSCLRCFCDCFGLSVCSQPLPSLATVQPPNTANQNTGKQPLCIKRPFDWFHCSTQINGI